MGLDEELETIEDGAETEAEQIDQETELEDVEEFQNDEEFDPSDDETDLEEAYEGFFAEEGPDGEGETSLDGEDGGLAAVASQAAGIDLADCEMNISASENTYVESGRNVMYAMADTKPSGATTVRAGQLEFTASVSLTYSDKK